MHYQKLPLATQRNAIMWQYILKIAITSAVVVAVAEIAKRSPVWVALVASLPLTSLLAFVWLYADTGESERIAVLSQSIFWLVLLSLALFLVPFEPHSLIFRQHRERKSALSCHEHLPSLTNV